MFQMKYYDLHGNEVRREDWADALTFGILEQHMQRIADNVSQHVCPEHGGAAELTFQITGEMPQPNIEIKAIACCDAFAQEAIQKALDYWGAE